MSTKQKTILQSGAVIAVILVLFIVLVNALNGPNRDEAVIDSRSSETSSESVVSSDESVSSSSSLLSRDESSSESVSRPPTSEEVESQRQADESERKAVEESQRIEESNRVQASIDESIRIEKRVNESLAAIEQERRESEAAERARNEYAETVRQRELAKIEEERKQKQAEQESIKQESIKQESIKQESIKQESIRQESIAEESRRLESVYQESIKQESIEQESIKQESIKQESIEQESIKQESIRQESIEAERRSIEESVKESIRIDESNKQASISESIRLEQESKDETPTPEPTPEPEVTPEPAEPLPVAPEGLETLAASFKWLKGYQDGYILFSIVDMGETAEEHVKTVDTHIGLYEQGVHVSGLNQNVYIIGDTTYYDLNKELGVINNEALTSVYQDKYGIKVSDGETGITDEQYRTLVTSTFTQLEEFVLQLDGSRVYKTESGLSELELTDDEVTQINELYAELFSVMGSEHTLPKLEGAKYYLNVSDTGLIGSRVVDAEGIEQYKLAIGSERREWPGFNVDEVTTVDYTEFESEVEAIQPEVE